MPRKNPDPAPVPAAASLQPVTQQRAWQLLRTHFALSKGFSLVLISAPDEWTLSRLRSSLPDLLPQGCPVRDVFFDSTFQPETFASSILGTGLPADADGQLLAAESAVWAEAAAPPVDTADPLLAPWLSAFSHLNHRRNALPRTLHGPLLIAGTAETLAALREAAPDLHSIRSTQLSFDQAPPEPGMDSHPALQRRRLAAYRRSLLAAFRPYQELALDNFAAAEQACPDIWDIFVHPACATEHLRPEQMDAAQRETPPRLPAQDLLPLLAQDSHRRTVLLADPGMGKSTLVQSLVAHLASGRTLAGAAALTGLLPVPLILRDLVPLLPQDKVSSWTWDALLTAFLEKYQRDDTSPPLCAAFHEHLPEFRAHLATNPAVFFLIDGLDEIGDLPKRRQIVRCLQDGIRAVSIEARWLVTSRVIGYEQATVENVFPVLWPTDNRVVHPFEPSQGFRTRFKHEQAQRIHLFLNLLNEWNPWFCDPSCIAQVVQRLGELDKLPDDVEGIPSMSLIGNFSIAQRLYLAPFDDRRQDQFTQRWFQHRHSADYSRQLMEEVRRHHHDGVRVIARVPNLLCLMNILKRSGKPLPDGRAALYEEIVKAYLGGIDAAYRLRPIHGTTCPFDAAQRRFLLALLGAHMQQTRVAGDSAASAAGRAAGPPAAARGQGAHEAPETISKPPAPLAALGGPSALPGDSATPEADGNLLISRAEISALLVPVIEPMLQGRADLAARPAAEWLDELLHHIASRSGLLIPRSTDADGQVLFGFTHLSFLEYFAAEWLGREFDRQRNRIVRRSEAAAEGQELTETDLDQEFPPAGPVQHPRQDFEHLPAHPAWHEPLIFLLESRRADSATLLRWLFPALHSSKPHLVSKDDRNPRPLLPLEAVRLVVKLALDTEVALPEETRRRWWQRLWGAYLDWPHPPWDKNESWRWPIAPVLLERQELRAEVMQALVAEQPRHDEKAIYLFKCESLVTSDLRHLNALQKLNGLSLDGCTSLEDTSALADLPQINWLTLNRCTGIQGSKAWQGISRLRSLRSLYMLGCTGLVDTEVLAGLSQLEVLDLRHCTGLQGNAAWNGLGSLRSLKKLYLSGCTGLTDTAPLAGLTNLKELYLRFHVGLKGIDHCQGLSELQNLEILHLDGCNWLDAEELRELRKIVRSECRIIGPDGEDVEP